MQEPTLPKFTLNRKGVIIMVLGAVIPVLLLNFFIICLKHTVHIAWDFNTAFVFTTLLMWLGTVFSFDYFVCRKHTHTKLNFNMSFTDLKTYGIVIPMTFGLVLMLEYITSLIPTTGDYFGASYEKYTEALRKIVSDPSTTLLLTVVIAPVFEEIVFRGIIQKGLINKGVFPFYAIGFSALVFGLVHGNPWQALGAVSLGSVFGFVYYKTGSLLLPILLHALNNFVSAVLLLYRGYDTDFSDILEISKEKSFGIGLIVFIIFLLFFNKKHNSGKVL
ncbi:MAG: CPBP family intramembrane metalloprotease [Bergeyella sp.]|nr:CPBP family intramembrane metalloprotease [Bergeyella sp.]